MLYPCNIALENVKGDNEDQTTGIEIVKRAIEEPLRQIATNAGKEGAVVVQNGKQVKMIMAIMPRLISMRNSIIQVLLTLPR